MAIVDTTVRDAAPSDASAIADVYAAAWREAYLGIIPAPEIERGIARRGAAWWLMSIRRGRSLLVSDVGGTVAGYASYGRGRLRGLGLGEIYELYVLPEYQGIGLGRRLFSSARQRLTRRGLHGLTVWCLDDNERAREFYGAMGGRETARSSDRMGGVALQKTAFVWR